MQTFLPYVDFYKSLSCLDNKRLGKQRVEARQIYNIITGNTSHWKNPKAWANHPAVLMWKGYSHALALYHDTAILVWESRGNNNTMELKLNWPWNYYNLFSLETWSTERKIECCRKYYIVIEGPIILPKWLFLVS